MTEECLHQSWFEKAKDEFLGKRFNFPNTNLQTYKLIHIEPKYLLFEDDQGTPLLKELSKNVQWKDYYKDLVKWQTPMSFHSDPFKYVYDSLEPGEFYIMGLNKDKNCSSIHSLIYRADNLEYSSKLENAPYIRRLAYKDFYVPALDFRYELCLDEKSHKTYLFNTRDHILVSMESATIHVDLNGWNSQDDPEFCWRSISSLFEKYADIRLYRKPF